MDIIISYDLYKHLHHENYFVIKKLQLFNHVYLVKVKENFNINDIKSSY